MLYFTQQGYKMRIYLLLVRACVCVCMHVVFWLHANNRLGELRKVLGILISFKQFAASCEHKHTHIYIHIYAYTHTSLCIGLLLHNGSISVNATDLPVIQREFRVKNALRGAANGLIVCC